ncbi:hypothetical protein ONS95_012150 [Cadophora gregata]|uniref:uncharacterized protein n=1 Tax=Cadophora gregata TaxID=51156 RepID=UPI0026DB4FD3|nr:uncharacterized protein ONS95_012150 [Cadophora gregata]KAK0117826.1 hypothetical protein ONS95_012150 [Cadophora gregata]KAK0122881.1 hypothetical protein ONS96_009907 [Cadophora gregata f. sp. sojae]
MRLTTTTAASSIFSLLLFSTTTLAAPAPQTTVTPGAPTPWSVTSFTLGCSPAGCTYSFSISGPSTPGVGPAFSTTCSGTDLQNKMVPCAKPEISANLVPTDQGLVLQVNRLEKQGNGDTAVMSGSALAAGSGEPAEEAFTVEAYSYGVIVG